MQNSPISQFTLHIPQQQPRIPNILRTKQKTLKSSKNSTYREEEHDFMPQQIVINANQFIDRTENYQTVNEGIRADIDACLEAVSSIYCRKLSPSKCSKLSSNQAENDEPVIAENAIHRIDKQLIMEFIETITKDYGIRDRFGSVGMHKNSPVRQGKIQYEVFNSAQVQKKMRRKTYLHLTLSSKRDKNQSVGRNKLQPNTNARTKHSPTNHNLEYQSQQIDKHHNSSKQKIPAKFRYCLYCQAAILAQNIQFHEINQCSPNKQSKSMCAEQLSKWILNKINQIKQKIKQNIQKLQKISSSINKCNDGHRICEEVIQRMNNYAINIQPQQLLSARSNKNRKDYFKFKQSISNIFFYSIDLTHKLNWFIHTYEQVKHQNQNEQTLININRFIASITDPIELYNFIQPKQLNADKYERDGRQGSVNVVDENRQISHFNVSD